MTRERFGCTSVVQERFYVFLRYVISMLDNFIVIRVSVFAAQASVESDVFISNGVCIVVIKHPTPNPNPQCAPKYPQDLPKWSQDCPDIAQSCPKIDPSGPNVLPSQYTPKVAPTARKIHNL